MRRRHGFAAFGLLGGDAFVRKEAVVSSQIEGTQATLVDLLTFEALEGAEQCAAPNADVEEVCNYLDALAYARTQLVAPKGLPLSMRLLSETHRRLTRGVRGAEKLPGEVRRSQNWIGGTRPGNAAYVPLPPHALGQVLGAFEKYLHVNDSLPPLVRARLLHARFESRPGACCVELSSEDGIEEGPGRLGHLVESEPRQLVSAGNRCVGRRPSAERRGRAGVCTSSSPTRPPPRPRA